MHWVLQDNIFSEKCFHRFIDTFEKFGLSYQLVSCIPFVHEVSPSVYDHVDKNQVVAIGSYGMTKTIKKTHSPASWVNDNYDCRVWMDKWNGHCFNEPNFYKFKDVPTQNDKFFIRPTSDGKEFAGTVYEWNDFRDWQERVLGIGEGWVTLDGDTNVLVSDIKPIVEEYRFVVVEGKLISGSTYGKNCFQRYIDVGDRDALIEFAEHIISLWTPSDVFVLDIVLTEGEYKVMEMGNFNSAGLYENDIQKVVHAIEDMSAG